MMLYEYGKPSWDRLLLEVDDCPVLSLTLVDDWATCNRENHT